MGVSLFFRVPLRCPAAPRNWLWHPFQTNPVGVEGRAWFRGSWQVSRYQREANALESSWADVVARLFFGFDIVTETATRKKEPYRTTLESRARESRSE
jgi:hypothetical protein